MKYKQANLDVEVHARLTNEGKLLSADGWFEGWALKIE